MKSLKYVLTTLLVIILALLIYTIESKKKVKLLRKEVQLHLSKISADRNFISSLIINYEDKLSHLTEEDYLNAQKPVTTSENTKFCIVVSSYNNVKYASQNLNSIFRQNYHNWRMKYIDDASDDGMGELVAKIKQKSNLTDNKFLLQRNEIRTRAAVLNIYEAAHNFCNSDEVLVLVDGDDLLATNDVLRRLDKIYSENNVWLTYGRFIQIPSGDSDTCCNGDIAAKDWDKMRSLPSWNSSHLRTAYTWLFKKINIQDLKYKNEFMKTAWDKAIMFPMLEMAGKNKVKFINEILYLYRMHPSNDHFIYREEQNIIDKYIQGLPSYKQINTDSKGNLDL